MDIKKEREAFNKEFGINNADTFPAFSGGIESSAVLKCNWLGWKKRAELECKENPETIEIEGLKTIHKLCKFADEHNMEGCTFTEIVECMFSKIEQMETQVDTLDEMLLNQGEALAEAKAQVSEGYVVVPMEPTEQILNRMTNAPIEVNHLCDNADIFLSEDEARIAYKAMIEVQEQKG